MNSISGFDEHTVPMHWPVGFEGDGEFLCPSHAKKAWGVWDNGLNIVYDSEGNEVYTVYSWHEGNRTCSECFRESVR